MTAGWVAGDDAFGMSPSFRDGLSALGTRYVLGRSGRLYGVAGGARVDHSDLPGPGWSPRSPDWWADSGAPCRSAVMGCLTKPGRK